jgi:hypothetical protein
LYTKLFKNVAIENSFMKTSIKWHLCKNKHFANNIISEIDGFIINIKNSVYDVLKDIKDFSIKF